MRLVNCRILRLLMTGLVSAGALYAVDGHSATLVDESTRQKMLTVYDGRIENRTQAVSRADRQIIQRSGIEQARRHWGNQCESNVEFLGTAPGSFTHPRTDQKAILYRYCETGHNFANSGIAIIANGRLVGHFAYNGGSEHEILSLPDINGNGISELVLAGGATNQGYTVGAISVIEIDNGKINQLGDADTYSSDCGAIERGCRTMSFRVLVKGGPRPSFWRETYRRTRRAWIRSGTAKPLKLRSSYQEPKRVFTALN